MPKPHEEEMALVTWRVPASDLELLRILHPGTATAGGVNGAVRQILRAYCNHRRVKMGGEAI